MSKKAIVIGAGSGVGRATTTALVATCARVWAVGRDATRLAGLGAEPRPLDATDPAAIHALIAEVDPDLVVIAAGARPKMAPVDQQSWESFSEPWNTDVRIAFEVGQAALGRPLRDGSTVVIVSSGAGIGGSPLSGGYAGAKRMQMFLASYLQRESAARHLGIRFVSLAPRNLLAGTPIAEAAAAAYQMKIGPLDPDGVARAILQVAAGDAGAGATQLGLTATGIEVL
jgi:NADP-dependent 3-hydroxy acid dehydrogenase YdfG